MFSVFVSMLTFAEGKLALEVFAIKYKCLTRSCVPDHWPTDCILQPKPWIKKIKLFYCEFWQDAHIFLCVSFTWLLCHSDSMFTRTQKFGNQLLAVLVLVILRTNCLYVSSHPAQIYADVLSMDRKTSKNMTATVTENKGSWDKVNASSRFSSVLLWKIVCAFLHLRYGSL